MAASVHVVGRFPPPLDGQSIATRRLADLLQDRFAVRRADLSAQEKEVQGEVRMRPGKVLHYVRFLPRLNKMLAEAPQAPVLWTAVSSSKLGHWRDLMTTLPAFKHDQPVWGIVHRGDFENLFRSRCTHLTAQFLVRRLRGFVFLSKHLADRCASFIPETKRFVVPNTIDEELCYSEKEIRQKHDYFLERSTFQLLFLSNMIPSKGYGETLNAVRLLCNRAVDVKADFVGGWPAPEDQTMFRKRVRVLNLEKNVTCHGSVRARKHIKKLYMEADALVLPTYYPKEAQPLTILEALNAGVPVVATRRAGIPEMVTHKQEALLVPPRDPQAIAEAVLQLHEPERWLRFSRAARSRFEEQFSPEVVHRRWVRLIQEATPAITPPA